MRRDEADRARDAPREHGGERCRDDGAERACGEEREPERLALRLHGARRSQEHDDVGAARPGRVQILPAVDRDPPGRCLGQQQAGLLGRKDREPFVLRLEEPPERAGRRTTSSRASSATWRRSPCSRVLQRSTDEVHPDEERQRVCGQDGDADCETKASLQRAPCRHVEQAVAHAPHRLDQVRAAELLAQLRHVDVDSARSACERQARDALEQAVALTIVPGAACESPTARTRASAARRVRRRPRRRACAGRSANRRARRRRQCRAPSAAGPRACARRARAVRTASSDSRRLRARGRRCDRARRRAP